MMLMLLGNCRLDPSLMNGISLTDLLQEINRFLVTRCAMHGCAPFHFARAPFANALHTGMSDRSLHQFAILDLNYGISLTTIG